MIPGYYIFDPVTNQYGKIVNGQLRWAPLKSDASPMAEDVALGLLERPEFQSCLYGYLCDFDPNPKRKGKPYG